MTDVSSRPVRIATRASRLALWQAEHVAALLRRAFPDLVVEIVHVSTIGDRDQTNSLRAIGPFGVFTREVQKVVLDNQADLAVHSLKDLPTERVEGLLLAAVPERGPMFDTLVLPAANASADAGLAALPEGARVGTESLRRRAQLQHLRRDLTFLPVRGNVETRLRKLDEGEYDALVLAVAGLERLELGNRVSHVLQPPTMYPAVGQGALGLECREDDDFLRGLLAKIEAPRVRAAVTAERALLAHLHGGCHAPLGVWTEFTADDQLLLEAVVLSVDGETRLLAQRRGASADAEALGQAVADDLHRQGAEALINAARRT